MKTPCWCPFQGHKYGRQKSTETPFFELAEGRGGGGGGYLSVNSSIEELIKIEVILILFQDKEYLDSKISKNPHKEPSRPPAKCYVTQKAWKFKRLLLQTKIPLKICVNKGF